MAGLVVADSPVAGEARRRLLPFRDVFAVLFFVAIGSLLEPQALLSGLGWVVAFLVLMLASKSVLVFVLARLADLPRPAQIATGLSQMGEFGFVLASALMSAGAISTEIHTALLAAVAISIAISAVAARAPMPGWTRGSEVRTHVVMPPEERAADAGGE